MNCKKCGSHIDETTGLCPICDSNQVYSNLKKAPENNSTDNKADLSANNGEYSNLKKAEQSAPVQQNKQMPQVNPVQPVSPVQPVVPVNPVYPVTPLQPVRDISGWSKRDIKALDKAEKIENRNRSTKIKNAVFKGLAVILASVIAMTAVTGAFVYWDKLDIPAYANALEFVGLKNSGGSGGGTGNNNSVTPSGNEDENSEGANVSTVVQTNEENIKALKGTEEDAKVFVEEVEAVSNELESAEKNVAKKLGNATAENSDEYLVEMQSYFEELKQDGSIVSYEIDGEGILAELPSGVEFFYAPDVEGYDSGTSSATLQIGTYQPCRAGYTDDRSAYMGYVDEGAEMIDKEYSTYEFNESQNYDDDEVVPSAISASVLNNVILWHGHGGYSKKHGPALVTGLNISLENIIDYYEAFKNKELLFSFSGNALLTREFINNRIADGTYDNTVVYLATCLSGYDETLAQAFINKGAKAVIVNNESILTTYNISMVREFSKGLTQTNDSGDHYNVEEALNYAMDNLGNDDGYGAHPYIVGEGTFTLDWFANYNSDTNRDIVIVLDTSGSMSGDPLDQTKIASNNFIKTILDENQANIGIVDYNSGSNIDSEFTSNADRLHNTVNGLSSGGGTNIESGLASARAMLSSSKAEKKIIVLMSDGCANEGKTNQDLIDYAETLKAQGIYIYTLGFFNDLSEYEKTEAQVVMDGIASDGCHYEVDDANNLVYFFDDIASQINGTRYIYVKIACPVDVTVKYDGETLSTVKEDQTRTSFGTLTYLNAENDKDEAYDFDSESEGDEDKIKMLRLKEGVDYDIQIEGYDDGEMDYSIGFMDENGEYTDFRDFEGIEITKHTVIDTKAEVADTTTLKVDEDGDGKYDYTMRASANGFGQMVKVSKLVIAAIFVSGGAVMLIAVVISVKKKKKRKALIKRAYKTA